MNANDIALFRQFQQFIAAERAAQAWPNTWADRVARAPPFVPAPPPPPPPPPPPSPEDVAPFPDHPPPRYVDYAKAMRSVLTNLRPNRGSQHPILWEMMRSSYANAPQNTRLLGHGHHGADGRFYFSIEQPYTVEEACASREPYTYYIKAHVIGYTRGMRFIAESVDIFVKTAIYNDAAVFTYDDPA